MCACVSACVRVRVNCTRGMCNMSIQLCQAYINYNVSVTPSVTVCILGPVGEMCLCVCVFMRAPFVCLFVL